MCPPWTSLCLLSCVGPLSHYIWSIISLSWYLVPLKQMLFSSRKLVNQQAQSRSEPVTGPRANETTAFYTVRPKETKWQVQTITKQKTGRGGGTVESVNQLITADHISLITFNIVIKPGLEVLWLTSWCYANVYWQGDRRQTGFTILGLEDKGLLHDVTPNVISSSMAW